MCIIETFEPIMSSWNKFFLFSIMTIFNLFSKGTSGMELFVEISKRLQAVDYFRKKLRLSSLVVSSYAHLFNNKQEIDY